MTTVTVFGRHWGCYSEIDVYCIVTLNLLLISVYRVLCFFIVLGFLFFVCFSFFKGINTDFRVRNCAPNTDQWEPPSHTMMPTFECFGGGIGCFVSLTSLHDPLTWAKVKLETVSLIWKQFVNMVWEDAKAMTVKEKEEMATTLSILERNRVSLQGSLPPLNSTEVQPVKRD